MLITTSHQGENARYWYLHNTNTGITYQLSTRKSDTSLLIASGQAVIYIYDQAAIDFWQQLCRMWDDNNYQKFIQQAIEKCGEK